MVQLYQLRVNIPRICRLMYNEAVELHATKVILNIKSKTTVGGMELAIIKQL